jgi:hypothetical protein
MTDMVAALQAPGRGLYPAPRFELEMYLQIEDASDVLCVHVFTEYGSNDSL